MSNTGSREQIPDDKQKDLDDVIGWDCEELWTNWQEFKDEQGDVWEFYELLEIVRDNNLVPPNNFLLIDEMHDAYPLLNDVVQYWIEKTKEKEDGTVIVAGDPYQVINSYQGADPKYFNQTDLPELVLTKTFRCPEHVWNYATDIINKEFNIHDVEPQSTEGELKDVDAATLYQEDGSDEWEINDNSKWTPYHIVNKYMDEDNEVMFLVRTNSQIEAIGQQLDELGIMYNGQFSRSWTDSDCLDIYNVIQKINIYMNDAVDIVITKEELQTMLNKIPSNYIKNNKYTSIPVSELNTVFTEEFINMNFSEVIEELRITNDNETRLKLAINRYNDVMNKNSIQVSIRTIHEAKGMEAENVVVYDSSTNRIQNKMEDKEHIKESECRTWFVAATRSSKNLFILRDGFQKYPSTDYLPEV
jgi:DNA helicase-2/ATP-dependent DNA helicase PcrA